jgi:hypothetical protein
MCNGRCIDVLHDPDNCGACGNVCGAQQACALGVCSSTCSEQPGTTRCGRYFAGLQHDLNKFGAC